MRTGNFKKSQEAKVVTALLQTLLKQAEQLTYEERLELIRGVAEMMKLQPLQTSRKRKLSEFRGLVRYPFFGQDAQTWVSQTRQEGDDYREQVLRGEA